MKKLILALAAASLFSLTAGTAVAGGNVSKETYSRVCKNGDCTVKRFEARNGRILEQTVEHERAHRRYDGDRRRDGDRRYDRDGRDDDHWDNRRHNGFTWGHDRGHHYGWWKQRRLGHGHAGSRTRLPLATWLRNHNYDHPDYRR